MKCRKEKLSDKIKEGEFLFIVLCVCFFLLYAWTSFTTSESEKWNNTIWTTQQTPWEEIQADKEIKHNNRKKKDATRKERITTFHIIYKIQTTKVIANVNRKRDAHYLYVQKVLHTHTHIRANKPCSRIELNEHHRHSWKKWNEIYQPIPAYTFRPRPFYCSQMRYLLCNLFTAIDHLDDNNVVVVVDVNRSWCNNIESAIVARQPMVDLT